MRIKTMTASFSWQFSAVMIILLILSFLGNYFAISLFFGVDFLFGSIVTFIVIRLFGVKWGVLAAFVASSYTYFLWDHPYAIVIFTLEAFFVGQIYKYKKANFIILDLIYWLCMGISLVWLFYYLVLNMDLSATYLIMLKQSINGIFNVMVANIIFYIPYLKKMLSQSEGDISFNDIIFSILIFFVLIPTLLFLSYEGYHQYKSIEKEIISIIDNTALNISKNISKMYDQSLTPLVELAKLPSVENMQPSPGLQKELALICNLFPQFRGIYITNDRASVVEYYPRNNIEKRAVGYKFGGSDGDGTKIQTELKPVISGVFLEEHSDNSSPVFTIGVPVIRDGSLKGHVFGELDLSKLSETVNSGLYNSRAEIIILDQNKNIVVTTYKELNALDKFAKLENYKKERIHNDIFNLYPSDSSLPRMKRWEGSSFAVVRPINENIPWDLIVEVPVAPFQNQLYKFYINILSVVFIVVIIFLLLASHLAKWLITTLNQLTVLTKDLPLKILDKKDGVLKSPQFRIKEVLSLFNNFKMMEGQLRHMFLTWNTRLIMTL